MHLVLPDYTSVLDRSLSCTTHTLNLLNHETLCVPVPRSVHRPQGDAKEVGSRRYVSGTCARRCNWKAFRTKLRQCRAFMETQETQHGKGLEKVLDRICKQSKNNGVERIRTEGILGNLRG